MALNADYVLQEGLESYFVDKDTGLPLANGMVFFYEDDNRNNLKSVYELSGAPPNYTYTALPNPVILSMVGTPQDANNNNVAIYYYPYDQNGDPQLYYVVVQDSSGEVQFTREAWPNQPIGSPSDEVSGSTADNMISNPQFAAVNFTPTSGITLSVGGAGTTNFNIAPGWTLSATTTGASSIAVQQISLAGNSNYPTNPPYSLRVTPGGNMSSLALIQTLESNPNIWASIDDPTSGAQVGGYVATSITLGAQNSGVTVNYVPNSGTATQLLTGSNGSGIPATLSNTVQLPPPDNTSTSNTGYVDIVIQLNTGATTEVTSVQVMGMATEVDNVAYQQTPVARQYDQLAHYYIPLIQYKPVPSYLVGWDFKYNPAQILGDSVGPITAGFANNSFYAWDQTIVFQSVDTSITVSRGTSGAYSGSLVLSAGATTQFALVQDLDQKTARELLSQRMSVNIVGCTSRSAGLTGKVTLWATTSTLPLTTSSLSIVGSLDAIGAPATLNGSGWTKIPLGGLPDEVFTLQTAASDLSGTDILLNGWDLAGATPVNTATYFAIVVGFESVSSGDTATFSSISLCAGDVATIPAPKGQDEVLRDCEYYYEKSYAAPTATGTITDVNSLNAPMTSGPPQGGGFTTTCMFNSFGFQYRTLKRVNNPNVTIYSATQGLPGNVSLWSLGSGSITFEKDCALSNNWGAGPVLGNKALSYYVSGQSSLATQPGTSAAEPAVFFIKYHYVVDARLGVV